jgi:hypothetical protein
MSDDNDNTNSDNDNNQSSSTPLKWKILPICSMARENIKVNVICKLDEFFNPPDSKEFSDCIPIVIFYDTVFVSNLTAAGLTDEKAIEAIEKWTDNLWSIVLQWASDNNISTHGIEEFIDLSINSDSEVEVDNGRKQEFIKNLQSSLPDTDADKKILCIYRLQSQYNCENEHNWKTVIDECRSERGDQSFASELSSLQKRVCRFEFENLSDANEMIALVDRARHESLYSDISIPSCVPKTHRKLFSTLHYASQSSNDNVKSMRMLKLLETKNNDNDEKTWDAVAEYINGCRHILNLCKLFEGTDLAVPLSALKADFARINRTNVDELLICKTMFRFYGRENCKLTYTTETTCVLDSSNPNLHLKVDYLFKKKLKSGSKLFFEEFRKVMVEEQVFTIH